LLDLLAAHEVTVVCTKGHAGDPDNERCDELARQGIQSSELAIDEGWLLRNVHRRRGQARGHRRLTIPYKQQP
jgi:ribonuclease HI